MANLEELINFMIKVSDSGIGIDSNNRVAYSEGYLDCMRNMGLISDEEAGKLWVMVWEEASKES